MSYSSNTSFGVTGGINGSRSGDKVDLGITKLDPNYAYFAFRTGTATRTVSGGEKRRYANLSYFGRASYDYAGKYFAQFTLRADAADLSILPLQKRWGYFPGCVCRLGTFQREIYGKPQVNLSFEVACKLGTEW